MQNSLLSIAQAVSFIEAGSVMLIAGSPKALSALPRGRWIGGSTPYFMTASGGVCDHEHVFCTVIENAADCRISAVAPEALAQITAGRFDQGFSYVLIPAFSEAHQRFAIEAPDLPDLYQQPLIGWVTGVELAEIGKVAPVAVNGVTGETHENAVLVMHVALADGLFAEADIINLFHQGAGDDISFPQTGFSAQSCTVNGVERNFAEYLRAVQADTSLPLVSNYAGAMINVSFQEAREDSVTFYAPVVAGLVYRLAAPVGDYPAAYGVYCSQQEGGAGLSFNCILNYVHAKLEGKTTGGFIGPVTFGEIAYILLNQTLVRLDVRSASSLPQAA
jgi:hypothetical protein